MPVNLFGSSPVVLTLLFLVFVGISLICVLAVMRYRPFGWSKTSQPHQLSVEFLISLLATSPYHWIVWIHSNKSFLYDSKTQELLDLPPSGQASITDLSQCFSPQDSETLMQHLTIFDKVATESEMALTLAHGKQVSLLISPANQKDCTILWIREVPNTSTNSTNARIAEFSSTQIPIPFWNRSKNNEIIYGNNHFQKMILQDPALSDFLKQSGPITHPIQKDVILGGKPHRLFISEHPVEEGSGFIGYAIDLTNNNLEQAALKSDVSALQALLNQVPLGVAIYSPNQKLSFFNTSYSEMFSLDTEWLKQQPEFLEVLDHLHQRRLLTEQANFPAYKQLWLKMFDNFATPKQELIHLPDERTLRMLAAPFGQGGLFFIFENITEKLVLERKANTQEAVNQEALEQLQEGVIVFASDNRLKLANTAFAKLWKLSPESLAVGRHISDVTDEMKNYFSYGQNWQRYKQHLIESLNDRKPKSGELNRKDGTIFSFSYVPLPDGTHLLSYSDITDSKRIHKALIERAKAFEEANNIKSNFLDNISENLKTA